MGGRVNEEVRQGAGFAALAYIFFLCIFVLIYKKNNSFSKYHAKQALVLFIGWVACLFFSVAIPIIGGIFSVLGTLAYLVFMIIGIFSSLMGLKPKFPIIAQIAERMVI